MKPTALIRLAALTVILGPTLVPAQTPTPAEQPTAPAAQQETILAGLHCDLVDEENVRQQWLMTLTDSPNVGVVRDDVRDLVAPHGRRRLHELA